MRSSYWQRLYLYWDSDRIQRLKDARSEASKEIEELKAQKNQEYQNFVAQVRDPLVNEKECVWIDI